MSSRISRRRRTSSVSQARMDDDLTSINSSTREDGAAAATLTDRRGSRFTRALSISSVATSGLSSSYNLPSRSYIHHAGHGSTEPVQYSSSGVRNQTAELSSSFIGDSDMARRFSPDRRSSDAPRPQSRTHEIIEERSEPVTPEETEANGPAHSQLTEALQKDDHEHSSSYRRTRSPSRPTQEDDDDSDFEDDHPTPTEASPLLPRERLTVRRKAANDPPADVEDQSNIQPGSWNRLGHHYPSLRNSMTRVARTVTSPKTWDLHEVGRVMILRPASMLPAVFLGVLLNLLDALSYGIILFPLGEEAFADLGADGVSMFYVSCIIAQLVYSTGSIFRGGVGSEMIEVVPFFHKMTYMIMAQMGTENHEALRSTVIVSYAMSSIITGVVFFLLGSARLGTLVNFFPHSILTGCIGGVGIFLFITGIEVSARLDGNLDLSSETMHQLFAPNTIALWIPPLVLAIALLTIKHYYDRPWLVPAYYIGITAIFYIITTAVPSISMTDLRSNGWVFEAPAAGVPFYNFYSHYKFSLVDWSAIWMTIPSQLALTFFGILHVPINVPNLAMVVQEDNVSINRELIMHGVSNTLSGCVGSIQNYLVFVNSVLFMDTGGNSRLAGYLLAAATFGLWVAGPVVIGYVPVMVVGTLIYMLGIDLAQEALVATYGRLGRLEYVTIIVIAFVMGVYDFVVGIAIGIGMACLVYVVQTSRKTVIRAEFSGAVAESTVRRHPRQRNYLHRVGPQIRVVKLGGYLFFGSIVKVEKKVRALIDAEAFAKSPIRYLVLDFSHVTGIDFSAAEAFGRMKRIINRRDVEMVLAGVTLGNEVGKSLQMVGLFAETADEDDSSASPPPKVFEDLNGALESCENELLMVFTEKQNMAVQKPTDSPPITISTDVPAQPQHISPALFDNMSFGSPRRNHLHHAATSTLIENTPNRSRPEPTTNKSSDLKQPLPLLLHAFSDLTTRDATFWSRALPFFTPRTFSRGETLYTRGDAPDGFYLLQSGILRAEYLLDQGTYHENIVAGTTCGELPFFSETRRTSRVVAESDCTAWWLGQSSWEDLQEREPAVAMELLKVGLKLSAERMDSVTKYVLITAS